MLLLLTPTITPHYPMYVVLVMITFYFQYVKFSKLLNHLFYETKTKLNIMIRLRKRCHCFCIVDHKDFATTAICINTAFMLVMLVMVVSSVKRCVILYSTHHLLVKATSIFNVKSKTCQQ